MNLMKKIGFFVLTISMLTLCACGTQVSESVSISSVSESVSAEPEVSISESVVAEPEIEDTESVEMLKIDFIKSADVDLNRYSKLEDVEVRYDEENVYVMFSDNGETMRIDFPESEPTDALKISDEDYLLSVCIGRGTECYQQELWEYCDGESSTVFSMEDLINEIGARVETVYTDSALEISIDGIYEKTVFLYDVLPYLDGEFEKVTWTEVIYINFVDAMPFVEAHMGIYTTGRGVPSYEKDVVLSAPVIMDEEGKYCLGAIGVTDRNPIEDVSETDTYPHIINSIDVDLNGNELPERIITKAICWEEDDDPLTAYMSGGVMNIEVYSDTDVIGDEVKGKPEWKRTELASCHAGNGQVFLTCVNGKYFIVNTDLYESTGIVSYRYEVLMLDYGSVYTIDKLQVDGFDSQYNREELCAAMQEFFEGLDKWMNDSSVVLVYSDIDADTDFCFSTVDKVIDPRPLYRDKSLMWK